MYSSVIIFVHSNQIQTSSSGSIERIFLNIVLRLEPNLRVLEHETRAGNLLRIPLVTSPSQDDSTSLTFLFEPPTSAT